MMKTCGFARAWMSLWEIQVKGSLTMVVLLLGGMLARATLGGDSALSDAGSEPWKSVSGIYPHLATFNEEGECGTGAVVAWADRLWVVSYAPHKPSGSTDKLYEITPALEQIIRPESIGGTPANRMIHRESQQVFIGPYAIGADRTVRVIPYTRMFGRHTGVARHLEDPAGKVVFATMEEGFYEVDVKTLDARELWADEQRREGRHADLPGYHGKGFFSAQGRYVYANNGDHAAEALSNPAVPSGCLAEWDGKAAAWTIVRRNQFTDVTGPGGIEGNAPGEDRLWSIGWDHRSLILMLLDRGAWHAYRLPKATHTYDGAHGWNTEWPRIREIGERDLLMTMHGSFWRFPRTFSVTNSSGIAPRSTYLKVVGDFCRWGDRVVLGCDDSAKSEFINADGIKGRVAPPGKSQSNLWFVQPERLDQCGPPIGRGAVWLDEDVKAGIASEPYLFGGFSKRSLYLGQDGAEARTVTVEIDALGNGSWSVLRRIVLPGRGGSWTEFPASEKGAWVRLVLDKDTPGATAFFHYRADDLRDAAPASIFDGLARLGETVVSGGLLHARGENFKTLRVVPVASDGRADSTDSATGAMTVPSSSSSCYDLDGELKLRRVEDPEGVAWTAKAVAINPRPQLVVDAQSVVHVDSRGKRWRLPKGDPTFENPGPLGLERLCREVCTERNLLNVGGTFYELPAENAGGFIKIRPIATHNRRIYDFASYRGMLVMSGLDPAAAGERIIRSEDGKCALWVGAVDDLWALGKPRGTLGVWSESELKAGEASDACLVAGYDRKRLTIRNHGARAGIFRVEADVAANGKFKEVTRLRVGLGAGAEYRFPDAFGAYWLRLVAEEETKATATLMYD